MPWRIEVQQSQGVIYLEASGALDLDLIKQMCSDAITTATKHEITRYLVDFRKMDPEISTVDIYNLPKILEGLGDNRKSRTAIVISPHSDSKKDFSFFETASLNQCFQVKLFFDVEKATEWLG